DTYPIEKIYQVAQLMREFELWPEARSAYQLVLDSPRLADSDGMKQRTLLGMGEASLGEGELEGAVTALSILLEEYPRSSIVLKGGISLARAYLAMEPPKPAEAREALSAVSRVLRSRPDKVAKAELDIMRGH